MTGPERIWINEKWEAYLRPTSDGDTSGYVRRDPAVPAALPDVQALIAAAIDVAAEIVRDVWARCEAVEDEAYAKLENPEALTEHERAFFLAQKMTAKSLRRSTEMPTALTPSATDALRAAEDRGIAIGLRAAAAWASDEANKCDDAAKWGGHRTYVANCKAAAYALRNAVLKIGGIKTAEARKIGGGE